MPKIIICRTDKFINRMRDYKISINGKSMGKLKPLSEMILEVESGICTVEASIDWCKSSKKIDLQTDDVVRLNITSPILSNSNFIIGLKLFIALCAVFIVHLYTILKYNWLKYILFLLIPFIIYDLIRFILYLTVWSDSYLKFEER
ncbi:MAG TPA: hypothetical protein VFD80_05995 [Flavobacteriaceae bacterium]|nr:hypothetical protein [Flavobacteriaceae bacterium]